MSYFSYAILGIIQGITEFLPVSSSGHLVLAQKLIPSFSSPGILLEVFLHAGTLAAVVYYFRKEFRELDRNYYFKIFTATIPAVIVGLFFKEQVEVLFDSLRVVGFALLVTSFFNYFTDKKADSEKDLSYAKGLLVGVFQALAIIPGISRSGSTIFAARSLSVSKKESARFSFLLSVPAIFGANLLEIITMNNYSDFRAVPLMVGFAAAFFSGLLAIGFTIRTLENRRFKYFAIYTAILGLLILLV